MPKAPHNEHMLELAIVRRADNDNERALADRESRLSVGTSFVARIALHGQLKF